MKKDILIMLFMGIMVALLPCFAVRDELVIPSYNVALKESTEESEKAEVKEDNEEKSRKYNIEDMTFKVLNEDSGTVEVIPAKDFVKYAIAAEMPAGFEIEALKAQGVAALSYAIYRKEQNRKSPDESLMGADFRVNPVKRQVIMYEENAKDFYGDSFQGCWRKITQAAAAAENYILEYENQPACAVYHAISSGKTYNSQDVWQEELPYLVSVDSHWDLKATGAKTETVIPYEKLGRIAENKGIKLDKDREKWIYVTERTDEGAVKTAVFGDRTFEGREMRELLDLRSAAFTPEAVREGIKFTVYGYGHGVGLSQWGAEFMARDGADFKEILAHYYPNTVVVEN